MAKVVCDGCGTVNQEGALVCELCRKNLAREAERAQLGNPFVLLLVTLGATGVVFVLPGVILAHMYGRQVWLVYLAVWVLGSLAGKYYEPKDSYDVGPLDNPFTLKDDMDRMHIGFGLMFIPMNFVTGLWGSMFRAFGHMK